MIVAMSRQMVRLGSAITLLATLCALMNPPDSAAWVLSILTAIGGAAVTVAAGVLLQITRRRSGRVRPEHPNPPRRHE